MIQKWFQNKAITIKDRNRHFPKQVAIIAAIFLVALAGSLLFFKKLEYYRALGVTLGIKSCLNIKQMVHYDLSTSRFRISWLEVINNLLLLAASVYLLWHPAHLIDGLYSLIKRFR